MNPTRRWTCLRVLLAVLTISAVCGAKDAKQTKGVFSGLTIGQSMSLKDEGSAFTITFFDPELPQSHKIIEIGENFIVVRDIAEITDTLVPIYSIKSIVKVRTKPK